MSDQHKPGDQQPGNPEPQGSELGSALSEMARQIEAVLRAAITSDRAKELQDQVTTSVKQLAANVENTVQSVQSDPRIQRVEERGREAWEQLQQQDVVQNVQYTLTTGLTQLNERLRKLAEGLEKKD
jgi:uncharacterized phage infection (PIP) family protein YhgE